MPGIFLLIITILAVLSAAWFFFGKIFSIRIIVPRHSLGLKIDAQLYEQVIPHSYIAYIDWKSPRRHLEYFRFVRANIYIERSNIGHGFPAFKNYLVPNPEFFDVEGKLPDVLLCKTHQAMDVLSVLGKTRYVGHTSFDNGNYRNQKNENLIVSFAGKSWLKNADKVIQAWLRNPDFPHLVITCSKKMRPDNFPQTELPANLSVYEKLSEEKLNDYARQAGAFLCPSSIEGFGHYINEGRAAGALVITTDHPPMNEFIDDDCGMLIDPDSIVKASTLVERDSFDYDDAFELKAATVSVENIENAIRQYMAMPQEERQKRRDNARSRYLSERDSWKKNLLRLFS